jgi:xylose isomerase
MYYVHLFCLVQMKNMVDDIHFCIRGLSCYYHNLLFPGGVCFGEGCASTPFLSNSSLLTRSHIAHHLQKEE